MKRQGWFVADGGDMEGAAVSRLDLRAADRGIPTKLVDEKAFHSTTRSSSKTDVDRGAASSAQGGSSHDTLDHRLKQFVASAEVFLSRPATATRLVAVPATTKGLAVSGGQGGRPRPSRPMSGNTTAAAAAGPLTRNRLGKGSQTVERAAPYLVVRMATTQRAVDAAEGATGSFAAGKPPPLSSFRRPHPPATDAPSTVASAAQSAAGGSSSRPPHLQSSALGGRSEPVVRASASVRRLVRPSYTTLDAVPAHQPPSEDDEAGLAAENPTAADAEKAHSPKERPSHSPVMAKATLRRRPVLRVHRRSPSPTKDGDPPTAVQAEHRSASGASAPYESGGAEERSDEAPCDGGPSQVSAAALPTPSLRRASPHVVEQPQPSGVPPFAASALLSPSTSIASSTKGGATPAQVRHGRSSSLNTSHSSVGSVSATASTFSAHPGNSKNGPNEAAASEDGAPTPPPRSRLASANGSPKLFPPLASLDSSATLRSSFSLASSRLIADSLKEKGNSFFRKEDYASALRVYTEALHLDPRNTVVGCNRASVYLLTGQYTAALVECKYVLLNAPSDMKAHWRAGKALLHLGKLSEARRHYRAARQASESFHQQSEMRSASLTGGSGGAPAMASANHTHHVKWLREFKALQAEENVLDAMEKYTHCMRQELYSEARQHLSVCASVFTGGGSASVSSVPWRAKTAEVNVFVDAHGALETIKALKQECSGRGTGGGKEAAPLVSAVPSPHCFLWPELDYVHAKALFFCAHDAASTSLCLRLLDEARHSLRVQQATVKENIRRFAEWTAPGVTDAPLSLDAEAWLRTYRVEEDSRLVALRAFIQKFERYRDEGNNAYLLGNWTAAYDAYTLCLQLDEHNKSLLSATYCNRSAVCMQANRWNDALNDASASVRLNAKNDKAYGRRARIHLNLFQQLRQQCLESQQSARPGCPPGSRVVIRRHLDCAVEDLRKCAELLCAAPEEQRSVLEQLSAVQQMRQEFIFASSSPATSPSPTPPWAARAASGRSWSKTENSRGFFFSSGDSSRSHGSFRGSAGYQGRATSAPCVSKSRAYLAVLGLPTDVARVEPAVLTRAYRQAALRWHPDKWVNGTEKEKSDAERQFKELNVAYQALKDATG